MQMTGEKFTQIGTEMFGNTWRKPIAEQLGLSYARISQLANIDVVPTNAAQKVADLYRAWKANGSILGVQTIALGIGPKDEEDLLADEQILARINKRFQVMDRMVDGMVEGKIRSLIVSGAPGVGKTFNLEKKVKDAHRKTGLDYSHLRGTCSAPGLYQALHGARNGGIVIIDDCDSIFNEEQAFNILKAALDTNKTRTIAWRKQSSWVYDVRMEETDDGELIGDRFPNEFDFEGTVVFITNLNFRKTVQEGGRLAPHLEALLSRSMYIDLTLHSQRSRIIRIKDVFINSMAKMEGLSKNEADEVLNYILDNKDRLAELSLRVAKKICDLRKMGDDWQDLAEYSQMTRPKDLVIE